MNPASKQELSYLTAVLNNRTWPAEQIKPSWPAPTDRAAIDQRLKDVLYLYGDLLDSFAYVTECNLATADGNSSRKSTPKFELRRQDSINKKLVDTCRRHGIPDDWSSVGPRLSSIKKAGYQYP